MTGLANVALVLALLSGGLDHIPIAVENMERAARTSA